MIPLWSEALQEISELVVDAYDCACDLGDVAMLEVAARRSVESVGATVVKVSYHAFQPHGLTLVLILQESHFILSTWPEHGMCIVNVFLCNTQMDAEHVWKEFSKALKPGEVETKKVVHRIGRAVKKKKSA